MADAGTRKTEAAHSSDGPSGHAGGDLMGAVDVARRQSEAGVAWSDRHGTHARARGAEKHGSDDQPRHRTGDEPGACRRLADRSTDWAGAIQRIVLADLESYLKIPRARS